MQVVDFSFAKLDEPSGEYSLVALRGCGGFSPALPTYIPLIN